VYYVIDNLLFSLSLFVLVQFSLVSYFGKIGGFIAPLFSRLGSSAGSSLSTGDAMAFFLFFMTDEYDFTVNS
jgi:hypothetical protein